MGNVLARVRRFIVERYDLEGLRTLCFDLGVPYDELGGEGLSAKARELVLWMGRARRLEALLGTLQGSWPELFEGAGLSVEPAAVYEALPAFEAESLSGAPTVERSGDTYVMSGDFRGAILNIKSTLSNVSQSVGVIPHGDAATRDELKQLIDQLNKALQNTPPGKAEEAEAVAESARMLVEKATEEKPNKTMIQITGEGLKQAAKNVADVMPTVLTIATQIVATVAKLVV